MLQFIKKLLRLVDEDESKEEQLKEMRDYHNKVFSTPFEVGIDCDEIPNAKGDFGHCLTNPIPVNGVGGEIKYLRKLVCECGGLLFFHRIGSGHNPLAEAPVGIVDIYEIVCSEGKHWDELYFDFYHPRRSTLSPKGYGLGRDKDFHPVYYKIPVALGVNSSVENFPFGLPEAILKAYSNSSCAEVLANKCVEIIEKNPDKFNRPNSKE